MAHETIRREIRVEGAARQHNVYIFPKGRARFAGQIIRRPGGFVVYVEGVDGLHTKDFSCPHAAEQYIVDTAIAR